MKKIMLLCSSLLILFSCQKQKDIASVEYTESKQQSVSPVPDEVKIILYKSGFDTSKVRLWKDKYLVDDIMLTQEHIKQFEEKLKAGRDNVRHAFTNNLITGNNTNITIRWDFTIESSTRWQNVIKFAISEWNRVANCRVNLILTDQATADITISAIDLGEYSYGQGSFPLNGQPGGIIQLTNRNQLRQYLDGPFVTLTYAMDVWTMIHEIGHNLGLRHTDWEVEGVSSEGANYFPGIPEYDPNSVMNSGRSTWLWEYSALTLNDIAAIQFLYPVIPGTTLENYIAGPELIWANSQRTHIAGAYYPGANYEWRLFAADGSLVTVFDETGPTLEWDILLLEDDDYTLTCRLINLEAPGVTFSKHIITRD